MSILTERAAAVLQLPGVRVGGLPVEPVRRLPTGIVSLDALLDGGLPRGHLSEVVGARSSGRTALLQTLLASATQGGEVVAVIDLPDALDPPSLARAGVELERVLWIRPPAAPSALRSAEIVLSAGGFALVAVDLDAHPQPSRERDEGASTFCRPGAARLPHAAWVRLGQVTRHTATAVVILASHRMTVSGAAVVLSLARRRVQWSAQMFDGIATAVELTRSRFGPPARAVGLTFGESCTNADGGTIERRVLGGDGGGAVGRAAMC